MQGENVPGVDSRRWTGPGENPAPLDRSTAYAAFRAAGGRGATAPQRAASAVSWIALVLVLPVVLAGAGPGTWLLGWGKLAMPIRAGLEGWLAFHIGQINADRIAALVGDPRILAALLTFAGMLAGTIAARRHRAALALGFKAAEASTPGSVFRTHGGWETALLALFVWEMNSPSEEFLLFNVIASWSVARFAAGGLVALAERRAAGLGVRGP